MQLPLRRSYLHLNYYLTSDSEIWFLFLGVISSPCDFNIYGTHGVITSESAKNLISCRWVISAPANHSIRLNFTIFQLDSLSFWKPTYIEAYNGKNESSTLLGKFTGTRGHFTVWTNGRFLLIKLTKGYKYSLCNFKSVFATSKSKGEFQYCGFNTTPDEWYEMYRIYSIKRRSVY